ncbi:OVARIAN TUMOR DOMAIN-containing deubiquitinating enzyme 1 [Linum perenne]
MQKDQSTAGKPDDVCGSDTLQSSSAAASSQEDNSWSNVAAADEDIMQQHSAIRAAEADKLPFIGEREPLSALAAEYQSGNVILQQKIQLLSEQYAAIRRTRGDGNCFFRGFMFAYLEHILRSQDRKEVDRVKLNVEECRKTLQSLGYADFTFEDFFALFLEQVDSVLEGNDDSVRFVTSGEIRKRSEFFEPFIFGLTNATVEQFCKSSVEPMGEESDHVHITALSDALGVPIRVVYLDRSSSSDGSGVAVNRHDFIPEGTGATAEPFINLLYRPGHYDILYPK